MNATIGLKRLVSTVVDCLEFIPQEIRPRAVPLCIKACEEGEEVDVSLLQLPTFPEWGFLFLSNNDSSERLGIRFVQSFQGENVLSEHFSLVCACCLPEQLDAEGKTIFQKILRRTCKGLGIRNIVLSGLTSYLEKRLYQVDDVKFFAYDDLMEKNCIREQLAALQALGEWK